MNRPIGVIDSGVGGMTVAKELMRQLPKEQLIYLGDTMRCPYGPRPKEEVIQYTWEMIDFLMEKEIKMVVIACNTATAFTLDILQRELAIPVIGVIQPGARAAIKMTQNMHIGVIGTEGTVSSGAYRKALHHINSDLHINELACTPFVPMVEQGILTGDYAYNVVSKTLEPLKVSNQIDTLILGCTHYPLLRDLIQEVMGESITIISSGEETAQEVSTILEYHHQLFDGERLPQHEFYTTGKLSVFRDIAEEWLNLPIEKIESIELSPVSK